MKITTDACLFGAWVEAPGAGTALEVGAGTGLLSLMLAQRTAMFIDAIELDAGCARLAAANFAHSPWSDRLRLICGDVRHYVADTAYTLLFSNPPFFHSSLPSPDLRRRQARHAITLQLDELLDAARRLLEPRTGKLALLWPAREKKALLLQAAKRQFFVEKILNISARTGKSAHCIAVQLGCIPVPVQEQEIACYTNQGLPTPPFHRLLAPYYLKF